jgi:dienelactone hydrolase
VHQVHAALDLVTSRGYDRIGLVGSSFGGLAAIKTLPVWPSNVRWWTLRKSFA